MAIGTIPGGTTKAGITAFFIMNYFCYILYSPSINKYYIGETEDLESRLELHNNGYFDKSYTTKAKDWKLFYSIYCESRSQARKIEKHIKNMKSRKYIENLKKHPNISKNLMASSSLYPCISKKKLRNL